VTMRDLPSIHAFDLQSGKHALVADRLMLHDGLDGVALTACVVNERDRGWPRAVARPAAIASDRKSLDASQLDDERAMPRPRHGQRLAFQISQNFRVRWRSLRVT